MPASYCNDLSPAHMLRPLIFCFFRGSVRQWLAVVTLLCCAWPAAGPAADRYLTQRTSFEKVLKAQAAGKHSLAEQLVRGLENYPLYPYYLYYDLRRRLHQFPSQEVEHFLTSNDGTYLGERLRREWLDQLGRAQRWSDYLRFYRPDGDPERRCLQLQARINTGLPDGVLADTRAVWLSAKSLPDACDPPFEKLYASDLMGDELLWQRLRLAMQAGNNSLARYLARRLRDPHYQAAHALWDEAHHSPARALARADLDNSADTRASLVHAVSRLARSRLESAEQAWQKVAARVAFTAEDTAAVAAILAVAAASDDHPRRLALLDAVPDSAVNTRVAQYRLREGIAAEAWPQVQRWTAGEPVDGVNPLRWRYWHARALRAQGRDAEAEPLLRELALERDYYGFLAADILKLDYQMNFRPVAPSAIETDTLLAIPGLPRARELYLLDRKFQARREWAFELARFDRRQLEVAASIAANWGWPDSAIFALGQAQSYDDLELRFPLLYIDIAKNYAQRRQPATAHIMAIMRSESAFVADARSSAGALGLMQLMPATARETARRIGLKLASARQLSDPDKNIALGSAYLAAMLKRYGGNFAMAAAAYNAGPHRVRGWQKSHCIEAEIWIDTIPFTETRRYVRRAYFYATVYESRMGEELTRITTVMPPIPARGSSTIADCRT